MFQQNNNPDEIDIFIKSLLVEDYDDKLSDKQIQYHINAAVNRGKEMIKKLEKVNLQDCDGLFEAYEESAAAMSHFYQLFPYVIHDDDTKKKIANLRQVDVQYKNGALKLVLHPLLPVPSKGGYNNYRDVFDTLSGYLRENDICFDLSEQYVLIYERVVKGDVHLKYGISDNDNIETRRVTNAIVDAVGIQDSADKLMFLYRTVTGDDYRMNVYFAPQDIVYTLPFGF